MNNEMSADLHLAEQNQQEEAPGCKCVISFSYHGSISQREKRRGEINDDDGGTEDRRVEEREFGCLSISMTFRSGEKMKDNDGG